METFIKTEINVRSLKLFLLLLPLSFLFSACGNFNANFNCTPLERFLGGDVNIITLGDKIAENLVENATPPLIPMHPTRPILTSTFVTTDDLTQTSRFGRLLQTHIGTSFVQRKYTVKEINLRHTMEIQVGEGEKMLSRDLDLIEQKQAAQAILVGTYSLNNRILYINAKLVDPKSRNILSAESYRLCMDDNLLALFGLQRALENADDLVEPPPESILDRILY